MPDAEDEMSSMLFYDIEVYQYDSLVVFKDEDGRKVAHFWSMLPEDEHTEDWPNGFESIAGMLTGRTIAGYNNYNYDDVILYEMMSGRPQKTIKEMNDRIVSGSDVSSERKLAMRLFRELGVESLDCMQQIDVSRNFVRLQRNMPGESMIRQTVSIGICQRRRQRQCTTLTENPGTAPSSNCINQGGFIKNVIAAAAVKTAVTNTDCSLRESIRKGEKNDGKGNIE